MQRIKRNELLIVAQGFYPRVGGAESVLLNLARELVRQGHSVTVLTARLESAWPRREQLDGVLVRRLLHPRWPVIGAVLFNLSLAITLVASRSKWRAVIINSVAHFTATAVCVAWLAGRFSLIRIQSTGAGGDFVRARRLLLGWLVCWWSRRADGYLATTSTIRDELLGMGIPVGRVADTPNGVDPVRFSPAAPAGQAPGPPRVVYLGRLVWQKRLDRLLGAWSLVKQRVESGNAILELHGKGPLEQELRSQTDELGLGESVRFCGYAEHSELALKGASAFVLTSEIEGMPNALIEAMAVGLPVIATDVSGAVDLIRDGENGMLVEGDDQEALANSIVQVLGDAHLAARLGEAARQAILDRYTTEHMATGYVGAVNGLG